MGLFSVEHLSYGALLLLVVLSILSSSTKVGKSLSNKLFETMSKHKVLTVISLVLALTSSKFLVELENVSIGTTFALFIAFELGVLAFMMPLMSESAEPTRKKVANWIVGHKLVSSLCLLALVCGYFVGGALEVNHYKQTGEASEIILTPETIKQVDASK
ncbi:hypothetical protein COF68_05920 [Bacillus toyonensis]|uniref:hypothetical protein n=1 Tax=Bacillus toyonensis TaxID=155322 RepID=UPI000BFC72B2|nr:hypothetical protein [Bacillus toyonensis]PHE64373.1 hypothetical protein COF68_05920 [Bacillus toyonensis]